MSKNKVNDLALARESQLIYNRTQGFKPVSNKLNRWQGEIKIETASGIRRVPIEIFIPLKFPEYPPRVIVLEKDIQHPNIEPDGNVLLHITHDWDPSTHVYQVILAAQDLFSKVKPVFKKSRTKRKATIQTEKVASASQQKVKFIEQELTQLQKQIKEREEELAKLRGKLVQSSNEKVTKIDDLEMILPKNEQERERLLLKAQNVALADLLATLDGKFKDGEISPIDFAKLYRRYNRELYIVQKKIEKL